MKLPYAAMLCWLSVGVHGGQIVVESGGSITVEGGGANSAVTTASDAGGISSEDVQALMQPVLARVQTLEDENVALRAEVTLD